MDSMRLRASEALAMFIVTTLSEGSDLFHMLGALLMTDEQALRRIDYDQVMRAGDSDHATCRTVDQVSLRFDLDMSGLSQTDDRVAVLVRAVQRRNLTPAPDVVPPYADRYHDEVTAPLAPLHR